jgi:ABC-2 type transport system permease protein
MPQSASEFTAREQPGASRSRTWIHELRAEGLAALAAGRIGFASTISAWPALLGRMIFYAVCLLVLGAFWRTVGVARLPAAFARSLPPGGLVDYVRVTEWITLSIVPVQLRIEDDVRSGAVEAGLLRPRSWLVLEGAQALGGCLARMASVGVMALALLSLEAGWPRPEGVAEAAVLGLGGAVIGIELVVLVGLCAFWLRRVLPVSLICQKLMFLLGGLFAPISLYRGWFHTLAAASPFAAHLNAAGEALIAPSWKGFAGGLGAQIAWTVLLALAIWGAGGLALAKARREGLG